MIAIMFFEVAMHLPLTCNKEITKETAALVINRLLAKQHFHGLDKKAGCEICLFYFIPLYFSL